MRMRMNSTRGRFRAALAAGGPSEARKIGKELGLPDSKIERWIKKFSTVTSSKKDGAVKCCLTFWLEHKGVIEEEGPEVSGVRFNDGTFQYFANEKIKRLIERQRPRASQ